ncbi:MAG TPA: Hsp20/alpha crystallin family protein [bacterium]|jgi:HSP20 family protein|nr:Hsp20/alpha crystallin family protein [bacterium]HOG38644.1 Hsp20/alpha crystallin family protein [bacterium]HQI03503.1 Hsp20/alpha crystallin family protein [bacterium]
MGNKKSFGLFKKSEPVKQKSATSRQDKIKTEEPIRNTLPKNWIEEEEEEGELLVDVYQEGNNIVIRSTVAGVRPEDIDIDINNDMITIRGKRKDSSATEDGDYFYRECYWGSFSRSIILPCEIQANKVKAALKDGVLTVVLPKSLKDKSVKINVERK